MKQAYIAIHDYGSGGALYRIFATSRQEVEEIFEQPTWKVVLEGETGCPSIPPSLNVPESDIDDPAEWLRKLL